MVLMKLIKREKKIVIIAVCNFVLINFREKMAPTKPIAKLGKCVCWSCLTTTTTALFNPFFCVEQKCRTFIKQRLRAPPLDLVKAWGQALKIKPIDIQQIYERQYLRYALGNKNPPHPVF